MMMAQEKLVERINNLKDALQEIKDMLKPEQIEFQLARDALEADDRMSHRAPQ